MKKIVFSLFLLFFCVFKVSATHNRAGQIVYRHISGYTYAVDVWTYTYSLSLADRDSLTISWGDGTSSTVYRVMKNPLPNFYIENKYIGSHTYPGPGTFQLVMEDPNRNDGVKNIPNSVTIVFAITTTLQINPYLGANNAAVLFTRPIDKAAVGRLFIHNPGAYDPDGDSLSYKMDTCRFNGGQKIPGFSLPPTSGEIYVNPKTGDFVWNAPTEIGIYNVAMRIEEWRNGIKISQIIRDIQIEVENSTNRPPVLQSLPNICVVAGDSLQFDVTATDPDNDGIYIERYGIPFNLTSSPATFPDSVYAIGTVTGTFRWKTNCTHIAPGPYSVTFKAIDDNPEVPLTDYKKVEIKVIGPSVVLSDVSASNTNVIVKWLGNSCTNIKGYKIYRKNSTDNFTPDNCVTGMPSGWGYQLIATINDPSATTYVDQHLIPGFYYCYRIVPFYTDDKIDGIVSNNLCVQIADGLPILTKSSVDSTSKTAGINLINWIQPLNFDTITFTPPYRYLLYIARDLFGTTYQNPIEFNSLNDTSYIDSNINTKDNPSCYKLDLQSYDSLTNSYVSVGDPSIASTPFLNIHSSNQRNDLSIVQNVPWQTQKYIIFRKNDITGNYDSIGVSYTGSYKDEGLLNLKEYCYKVETISHYSADSMPDPIINFSQIACGVPIDTIPPCCPSFDVTSDCSNFSNLVKWHMPADSCNKSIANYLIYYSATSDKTPELIATLSSIDTQFVHLPDETLAGCYVVGAVDSAGNKNNCTDKICVDVCSYYELPNIFTPNSDNSNDLFHPLPYKYVEKVDIKFYNRWGQEVFQTTEPDINWNGNDMTTNKPLPEGVYYYIGDVYEKRLTGIFPRTLSGFIQLVRNKKTIQP